MRRDRRRSGSSGSSTWVREQLVRWFVESREERSWIDARRANCGRHVWAGAQLGQRLQLFEHQLDLPAGPIPLGDFSCGKRLPRECGKHHDIVGVTKRIRLRGGSSLLRFGHNLAARPFSSLGTLADHAQSGGDPLGAFFDPYAPLPDLSGLPQHSDSLGQAELDATRTIERAGRQYSDGQ
jgi:hypothetical protein